jgi:hypothetical protein
VAAPGVGILSSIPGDTHLTLSGTSQATPYVTNIAGKIRDAGPNLTIPQVKELLMRTVDHKDFLQGKVVSGGIVNGGRAVRAAELMVANHTMDESVGIARAEIPDMSEPVALKPQLEQLYVTPLTALFQ